VCFLESLFELLSGDQVHKLGHLSGSGEPLVSVEAAGKFGSLEQGSDKEDDDFNLESGLAKIGDLHLGGHLSEDLDVEVSIELALDTLLTEDDKTFPDVQNHGVVKKKIGSCIDLSGVIFSLFSLVNGIGGLDLLVSFPLVGSLLDLLATEFVDDVDELDRHGVFAHPLPSTLIGGHLFALLEQEGVLLRQLGVDLALGKYDLVSTFT